MLYKLTDQKMQTRNGFQWKLGRTETASGEGDLCGPGWLHAYTHPLLAVLLNSIHADIENPRLFECKGEIGKEDHGLKVGCTSVTPLQEIPLPEITTAQRVRFGILCALEVYQDPRFVAWANKWLSGEDRSVAAQATAWAATAEAAATATTAAAERAARAAERAARARPAWATAAAWAAESKPIDLIALAKKAIQETV